MFCDQDGQNDHFGRCSGRYDAATSAHLYFFPLESTVESICKVTCDSMLLLF